jgi:uncharacterized protein YraI
MQKFITAITAIVYLLLTTGVAVNVHYCMGRVDGIQFSSSASDVCGRCGMHTDDSGGCCKDEHYFHKVDDVQNGTVQEEYSYTPPFITQPIAWQVIATPHYSDAPAYLYFNDTSPPPLLKDRCVMNGVFRI